MRNSGIYIYYYAIMLTRYDTNDNNKFIKPEVRQFLSTIINLRFLILDTASSLKPTVAYKLIRQQF